MDGTKNRIFELRCGATVQEQPGPMANELGGFTDGYVVLKGGGYFQTGDYACLHLCDEGFPDGGAHGADYDIVREIVE